MKNKARTIRSSGPYTLTIVNQNFSWSFVLGRLGRYIVKQFRSLG